MTPELSHEYLRSILSYDPVTGAWTWIVRKNYRVPAGSRAGSISGRYWMIKIDGRSYASHILAFFYMTGAWPNDEIDHEDTDSLNNVWENIREATRSQNCANRKIHKNNTSGHKGVTWHKQHQKWAAQIKIDGKHKHIGLFASASLAADAYAQAAHKFFGNFARTT